MREVLYDYLDSETTTDEVIRHITETFNLSSDIVACKVENHLSYDHSEHYAVIPDVNLYEWLNELIESEDCKNGCRIYKDEKTGPYFCISGANYYDTKTDKYLGTDEVRVFFKNFEWEKL